MHSTDHVLQDGVVHDHGAGEPVAAVVGVHGPVLAVDGLVLEELEVRVCSELVVVEEGGHVGAGEGFVDQHIDGGQGGGELCGGGESGRCGAVEEGCAGVSREDALVVGAGEGPGGGVVVVLGGGDVRGPGDDGLGGGGGSGGLEAVVVVVDGGGQLLGGTLEVEEGGVELEPLGAL